MAKNKYTTRYFEKYALLSLKHCSELSDKDFFLSESPDLQSDVLDIGIEVTRAIWAEDVKQKLMEEYFGRVLNGEDSRLLSLCPNLKDLIVLDSVAIRKSDRLKRRPDFKIHIQPISKSIITKTIKLNKNYKKFSLNGLYIFSFNDNISPGMILKEIALAEKTCEKMKEKYDIIIVNGVDEIFVYKRNDDILSVYPLSKEESENLKRRAEQK